MEHEPWLKDALVFLVAAGIVVPLFHRVRIGAALGFLAMGIVVGPYGAGRFADDVPPLRFLTIPDPEAITPFADLGIVFLLFVLGLEVSLRRLRELARWVFGAGTAQVVASAAVLGVAAGLAGNGDEVSLVCGLGLALSSTAIVMQVLVERRATASPLGRLALSVLLFQDLMVVPILFVIGILAGDSDNVGLALAEALAKAALAVAVIMVAGRFLLKPLFRLAASAGSRELMMAITLLTVVGTAVDTAAAGLSMALGAFLAGVLLAETEYRHAIEVDLEPFKGLLVGLFFMTVGMGIDLGTVAAHPALIAGAVLVVLLIKAVLGYGAVRLAGASPVLAGEAAFLLAGAGEFAFVVAGVAERSGVIDAETGDIFVAVAGVSMVAIPFLARCGRLVGRHLEGRFASDGDPAGGDRLEGHVVIGGFGRVGQTLARILDAEGVPFVAIDRDSRLVTRARREGYRVFYGDASRIELLERAGGRGAAAFAVTLDGVASAEAMVRAARELNPAATVHARARDAEHAAALRRLGAEGVIPEAVESSLALSARILGGLGIPDEVVTRRLSAEREAFLQAIEKA